MCSCARSGGSEKPQPRRVARLEQEFVGACAAVGEALGGVTSFGDAGLLQEGLADYERLGIGASRSLVRGASCLDSSLLAGMPFPQGRIAG